MKKILIFSLLYSTTLLGQGTRLQPGGVPTPVPVYNITQIVSNVVAIIGTNGGGTGNASNAITRVSSNNVPISTLVTNLNFTNSFGGYTSNRGTVTVDLGSNNIAGAINSVFISLSNQFLFGSGGFVTLITNGSPTAVIQSTVNGLTNGGVVSIQPGNTYNITAPITITNSIIIQGNGARFRYATGLTNYMIDYGTNFGKPILIQDLVFDGNTYAPFSSGTYFYGISDYRPYTTSLWTNRTGLRIESSGGAIVRGCTFVGWSGQGLLVLNKYNVFVTSSPRAFVINNSFATNFIGITAPGVNYDTPGYNHSDSSLWTSEEPEYTQIIDNQAWANQIAFFTSAGNCTVMGNIVNSNYTGMLIEAGSNEGHGNYFANNFNHNPIPIFYDSPGGGNGGNFMGNMMLQCGNIVFRNGVGAINFTDNKTQRTGYVFTNGVLGTIANNKFGAAAQWGVDFTTNISSGMRVYGNVEENGASHDGSVPSIAAFTTNSPTAGYFWSTTDLVHGQWVAPPSGGSGSLFPPAALGVLTNTAGGVSNWSTSIPFAWIAGGQTAIDTSSNLNFANTLTAIAATNNNVVIPQINSTSNQLYTQLSGGSSSFPLTGNTDAGGRYQLTNNSSISTTNFHVAKYDPFVTSTRLVFDGNSRPQGFGNPWPHWPGILYSNLLSQEHLAGYVNLGVAGRTVEQNAADYSTGGHVYRPATGTNAWYFWMDSINDSINSSNVQTTINAMSNILTTAKSDGYTVVACTAFEASAMTQAQLGLLAQANDYILTNTISDYVLDVHSWMNYGKLSSDGTHFSQGGDTNTAQQMYTVITSSRGNRFTSTHELRATDLLEVYSQGDIYNVRGRPTLVRLSSDIPSIIFDAGSAGGAFFGLYQGELNLWITNNSQNIPALNSFSIGSSRAAFMQPVHAQAGVNTPFITVTNTAYIPTNTAPGVVIASALLHTLDIGKGFTNDMNCKVTAVLELFFNESAVNGTSFAFQNTNTGASHYGFTNADPANILATYRKTYYFQHIGPGDVGSLFDTSGAGASVTKSQSFWITE